MITAALIVTWAIALLGVLQPHSIDTLFSTIHLLCLPTLPSIATLVQVTSNSVTRLALEASMIGGAFKNHPDFPLTLIEPTATTKFPSISIQSPISFHPHILRGSGEHFLWLLLTTAFVVLALAFTITAACLVAPNSTSTFSSELLPSTRDYDALAFLKPQPSAQDLHFSFPPATSVSLSSPASDNSIWHISPLLSSAYSFTGFALATIPSYDNDIQDDISATSDSLNTAASFASHPSAFSGYEIVADNDTITANAMWDYILALPEDERDDVIELVRLVFPVMGSVEERRYMDILNDEEQEDYIEGTDYLEWVGKLVRGVLPAGEETPRRVFSGGALHLPVWEPSGPPLLLPATLDFGWDSWD
ncbi:hypothetical protein C8Q78DRAFT_1080533 [Trametes maxima]|nr:hypothetical protein C8Q78DRAFT_1080533 [Trametes maxima]